MKIYTRTGDGGQTDTGTGRRTAKDSPEMEVVWWEWSGPNDCPSRSTPF
jgi:hypothetical protein